MMTDERADDLPHSVKREVEEIRAQRDAARRQRDDLQERIDRAVTWIEEYALSQTSLRAILTGTVAR